MTRINTNVSSLTAQNSLARSNEQLQTALTRLSTGMRINTGADDPAGLIAGEILKSSIHNTNQAITNSQSADQMINTADSALSQISSLLKDIRGLATQSANTANMSADQIAANQSVVDSSLEAINRIAQTTAFQGKNLLDGSLGFITGSWTNPTNVVTSNIQQANLGTTGSMTVSATLTTAATQGTLTNTISTAGSIAAASSWTLATGTLTITAAVAGSAMNGTRINIVQNASVAAATPVATYDSTAKVLTVQVSSTANTTYANLETAIEAAGGGGVFAVTGTATQWSFGVDNLTFTPQNLIGGSDSGGLVADVSFSVAGNKGSQVFQFKAGTTGTQIRDAINAASDAIGVIATFGLAPDAANVLRFKSVDYGKVGTVKVEVIPGSEGVGGTFASGLSATYAAGTDVVAKVNGINAAGNGNTLSVNTGTLNMTATVAAGLANGSTFSFTITGGGALFQLGPNVISSQQTRMGIQSTDTGHLGGTAGWLYQLKKGSNADLATNPSLAANIVDQAINQVTMLRGQLGAFQKTTVKANIATLTNTVQALSSAQSTITDADFAAETANLTRAQILTQSGMKVLQIANKNPENVLALLQ
ncbi:MAG: flagellin [Pirellulales bacterium]|nr:flagellin [Pirellulales bacterium]